LKHFLAILLTIVLLAPIAGSLIFFELRKSFIRNEVENKILSGLSQKEIMTLKFSLAETKTRLNWKHAREFEFEGQMFDIMDINLVGDTVIVSCFLDQKETRLKIQKEKIIAKALGHDPLGKNHSEKIKNFFNSGFHLVLFDWKPADLSSKIVPVANPVSHFCSIALSPAAPPPKCS
jgi:hypothetical protein